MVSCILPVALTRSIHPQMVPVESIALKTIVKKAPLALLGCFTSGLLISSFYTMGPVFCLNIHLSVSQISWFMTVTVLGGLLIQWPIGYLSDKFDRSIVIPLIIGILSLVSGLMLPAAQNGFGVFMIGTGLFGGFMFCIYPVAMARAYDLFDPEDVVNVSSALLLFYGIGSVFGPVTASAAIQMLDSPYAFYVYFSGISVVSAGVCIVLRHMEMVKIVPVEDQVDFIIMDHTSQMAVQIDPRSDPETSEDLQ
jgi:MFS family permease